MLKSVRIIRLTHNWWHVALCYMEGYSPIERILEVYDHHIWKELEKVDTFGPEVKFQVLLYMSQLSCKLHLGPKNYVK